MGNKKIENQVELNDVVKSEKDTISKSAKKEKLIAEIKKQEKGSENNKEEELS